MYKVTKYQKAGYLLMIAGAILCGINCLMNYRTETLFGNFYIYISSGIVFGVGLTLVFNEKIEPKNDQN